MRRIKALRTLACLFPAFFVSLLVCCPLTHAAGGVKADKQMPDMSEELLKSESPIHITADRMETKQDERTIVFEGHVFVQQDDLMINSNRLKLVLLSADKLPASSDSTPAQRIDYIEFEGSVKVTQKDRLATANKAVFYQKEQKIVLHGRPVVTRGQDRIEGNLITIYLQQGRSVVEGGSGAPVQAVLFPGKKE
ncbi:MAG: LptA/OstA family protein [Syntrophobacteraceae bacterium]|jgi:lipopolysaccharide export system protein LptA